MKYAWDGFLISSSKCFCFIFPCRTALIGYGTAPSDSVSLAIIITIAVGLGVPALFVVLGAIYVVYKKKPWENVQKLVSRSGNGYTRVPITDEEWSHLGALPISTNRLTTLLLYHSYFQFEVLLALILTFTLRTLTFYTLHSICCQEIIIFIIIVLEEEVLYYLLKVYMYVCIVSTCTWASTSSHIILTINIWTW